MDWQPIETAPEPTWREPILIWIPDSPGGFHEIARSLYGPNGLGSARLTGWRCPSLLLRPRLYKSLALSVAVGVCLCVQSQPDFEREIGERNRQRDAFTRDCGVSRRERIGYDPLRLGLRAPAQQTDRRRQRRQHRQLAHR